VPTDRIVLDDVEGRDCSGVRSGVALASLRSCQLVSPALRARSCSSADFKVERRVCTFGREGGGDFAGVEAGEGVLRRGVACREDMDGRALTGVRAAWDAGPSRFRWGGEFVEAVKIPEINVWRCVN
jgi:hypothetical protein